jgi:hypothetical protein
VGFYPFQVWRYSMTQAELKTLPSGKLFGCCASYFDDDRYWDEFVQRFNPCLTNSVYQTYRRFSVDGPPTLEVVSDLLQEIYLKILKDKCAALQRFRGASEFEAEVYLMHISTTCAASVPSNVARGPSRSIKLLFWKKSGVGGKR